ncbi:hypothetical protein, partial [Staphylococcus aureus]|uniref:hypothetical protein n=1 Tax=Staphylococcus aureus TaxID=1280 RepID=UPI00301C92F1
SEKSLEDEAEISQNGERGDNFRVLYEDLVGHNTHTERGGESVSICFFTYFSLQNQTVSST